MMNIEHIASDRQMKASIGFSLSELHKLSILFEEQYQVIYGISVEDKFRNLGKNQY